jgi:hypothetical protein
MPRSGWSSAASEASDFARGSQAIMLSFDPPDWGGVMHYLNKASDMDNHAKRSIGFGIVLIAIVAACGLFLYLSFFSFPPTETIAQNYFDAIIRKDVEAVLRLGRSDPLCQDNLKYIAQRDIERFGGTVVREVSITVEGPSGSDEGIQWARIEFQYHEIGQSVWKQGKMVISTDHERPGLRYTCGVG